MFTKGNLISFLYPASNFKSVRRQRYELRRVLVDVVRDLSAEPLLPASIEAEPDLCREGMLIKGYDLDRLGERCFYTGSMRELRICPDDETHAVLWVTAADGTLAEEGVCIERISRVMAEIIADAGNGFLRKTGEPSRQLLVVGSVAS